MSCCETQNLAVGYGAPLLRDIALHAERGKILALIGPNGAGPQRPGAQAGADAAPHGPHRADVLL